MTIYLQELASSTYLADLPTAVRNRIHAYASLSGYAFEKALAWTRQGVAGADIPSRWFQELSQTKT